MSVAPTSTSPQQYCSFYIDGSWMAIEVDSVQEILPLRQLTHVPLAERHLCGLINLRGQIVAAVDLRAFLGLPLTRKYQENVLLVLRRRTGLVGIVVDRVGDVIAPPPSSQTIPPDNVPAAVRRLVKSVYKLDEGLLLVADVRDALRSSHAVSVGD